MGALKNLHLELYQKGLWECPNSGILIPLGQKPISKEEYQQIQETFAMSEEEYLMSFEDEF